MILDLSTRLIPALVSVCGRTKAMRRMCSRACLDEVCKATSLVDGTSFALYQLGTFRIALMEDFDYGATESDDLCYQISSTVTFLSTSCYSHGKTVYCIAVIRNPRGSRQTLVRSLAGVCASGLVTGVQRARARRLLG
ncbi:hypothetical protein EVAR_85369_1 [Eumeta japonica]|uniref:Uncharacterized protein n=1 Tax=Eumeta variegata TaxID=151549 RepID=A0A4C1WRE2_EUMVA|nr:hypothetical protein EVAR_85369_1 [Eumeta japonica]